jgi:predicted ATP-grasp superfamily ATP-dependent carboligase
MESKKLGIDCYGLFGESFSEVPDMRAAASVISKFSKLVSIPLEVTDMINMASEFEHLYTQQCSQIIGETYSVTVYQM